MSAAPDEGLTAIASFGHLSFMGEGSATKALTPGTAEARVLEDFRAGKRPALARAISIVENGRAAGPALLHALHPRLGRARRIGITGPPGAGKSTLTAALIGTFRARGETVGVVAVDPTSPFTGGALLGDRIRMGEATLDPGVFIRSMATRGSLGGLALTTKEVADLLDAFGFDHVLIETVGVGQSELDIAAAADTTVVVLVPESGDSVQAMKAGLMEIADLFVINKADRPGAERMAREVEMMLRLRAGEVMRNLPAHHGVDLSRVRRREAEPGARADGGRAGARERGGPDAGEAAARPGATAGAGRQPGPAGDGDAAGAVHPGPWAIPVLQTVAATGQGVDELAEALDRHHAWLQASGELARRRRRRLAERVREAVDRGLRERAWTEKGGQAILEESLPALEAGTATPYEVAERIVRAAAG
ncbi:MAG TPA: methylmalonyl Co-A mutase-associated GTPase MeaB [Longimicrobiales bacterium]